MKKAYIKNKTIFSKQVRDAANLLYEAEPNAAGRCCFPGADGSISRGSQSP